ncbi:MAG: aminopeptidase P family protein [Planctomycetales bacterium]|nr:aminopeptidase P family protein [Planctomycetales bacterium]
MMAGIPAVNRTFYRQLRFSVGDPAAWVEVPTDQGPQSTLILRDIEMARAKRNARADHVACPADLAPPSGLSGDRETATAQAAAELLRRSGVSQVVTDRTLPYIFAHFAMQAGVEVVYDDQWGVAERRAKDAEEIELLREAQAVTEQAMEMACRRVARATAGADGVLIADGEPLTSDRLRSEINVFLMQRGYANPASIIASGPQGADCHDHGHGPLRTNEPVIVDIFPCNQATLYNGDCTRTVVHGEISPRLQAMHDAVVAAKAAAIAATRAGVTGEEVHQATSAAIREAGYSMGLPPADSPPSYCGMTHGTGHGIGLDVHEPPLLDRGGPVLVEGDALTIEPGLYCAEVGGVRVEDMVIVTRDGCINLNQLPEGLDWK